MQAAVGWAQEVAFSGEAGVDGSVWVGELLGGDFWGGELLGDSARVRRSLGDTARAGDTAGDSARPGSLAVRLIRLLLPLYLPGIDFGATVGQEQGCSRRSEGAAESSPEHGQ